MICLDTDSLFALWRSRNHPDHPVRQALARHSSEVLVVCAPVAGEFLEGAAFISEERLKEALLFLRLFDVSGLSLQTSMQCARTVATLRHQNALAGMSKADLWIAAWALEHNATLATQNKRHFDRITGLKTIGV